MDATAHRVTLDSWYRNRKVLVTGHTGFKGSWLTAWLTTAGADVTGYALPPEPGQPSLFVDGGIEAMMRSVLGDVADAEGMEQVARDAAPEIVFHLAAQSLVRRSYQVPVETFRTNVIGTAHLLDAVRRIPTVRAVVVVTSDKCYANDGSGLPFDETRPMGGHDPYSASKGCTELVADAYRASFFAKGAPALATARAGNVIGGGDWAVDRLVPDLVRAAGRGEVASIRHPEAVRPWQYVLEPLRGYLMLGRALTEHGQAFAEGWNFGPRPADTVSVRDVVQLMHDTWPRVAIREEPSEEGLPEAGLLALDCAKAAARLGWRPSLSLAQAVQWTTAWYRGWYAAPSSAPTLLKDELDRYRRHILSSES